MLFRIFHSFSALSGRAFIFSEAKKVFSLDLGDLRILEMVDCINTVAVYCKASPLDRLVLLSTIKYYSVYKLN